MVVEVVETKCTHPIKWKSVSKMVLKYSGFGLQMNLLDRAVKTVAELDEPLEMNFVRKHALEQSTSLGVSVREAATRIYSNASGSYSSNVNLAVENSSWNDEKQLQDMYLSRKSFAFDSDTPGAGMSEKRKIFEAALATADATFQNLDSSEISLTDVSHYFDSDPTKLVQSLRKDKKKPNAYIADTTTANAQVCIFTCILIPLHVSWF